MPQLIHKKSQKVLVEELILAHKFFSRVQGLLKYKNLKSSQALWIRPCSSLHTYFMKFPIDVIFVDQNLNVQCFYENIQPWKVVSIFGKVQPLWTWVFDLNTYQVKNFFQKSVFELKGGHLADFALEKGDELHVDA